MLRSLLLMTTVLLLLPFTKKDLPVFFANDAKNETVYTQNTPPVADSKPLSFNQAGRNFTPKTVVQETPIELVENQKALTPQGPIDDEKLDIDPFIVKLIADKDSIAVNEEFELKVLLFYQPKPMTSLPSGWENYTFKIAKPDNFVQTGGDYIDYLEGSLTELIAGKSYSITGIVTSNTNSKLCFRALRSTANSRNDDTFWLRAEKCLVLKEQTEVDQVAAFDPFEENKKLMETLKGDVGTDKQNENKKTTALTLTQTNQVAGNPFEFCGKYNFNVTGTTSNQGYKVRIKYANSSNWQDLNENEFERVANSNGFTIERKENGFLPTANFSIRVDENSQNAQISNEIAFVLKALPAITISSPSFITGQSVTIATGGGTNFSSTNLFISNSKITNPITPNSTDVATILGGNVVINYYNLVKIENTNTDVASILRSVEFRIGRKVGGCTYYDHTNVKTVNAQLLKVTSNKASACDGDQVVLTAENCLPTSTYTWRNSTGIIQNSSSNTITVTKSVSSGYAVDCYYAPNQYYGTQFNIPSVLQITSPPTSCGTNSYFLAIPQGLNNCTGALTWRRNNVIISSSTNPLTNFYYNATTSGSYTLTCSSPVCTSNAIVVDIKTTEMPTSIQSTNNSFVIPTTGTLTLIANCSADTKNFKWKKGTEIVAGAISRTLERTNGDAGVYNAQCENSCGWGAYDDTRAVTLTQATVVTPDLSSNNAHICTSASETAILSLSNCSVTPIWYRDNVVYTGGTVNNAVSPRTLTVAVGGTFYAKCGTVNSDAVVITSGVTPARPTVAADQTSITFGETANISTTAAGNIRWYDTSTGNLSAVISTESSFIADREGCFAATTTTDCGTSPLSDAVCVTYRQLRIDTDKTAVLPNEVATLTLRGCQNGFAIWENQGGYITGWNPVGMGAGTHRATCELADGRRLAWVSITIGAKALEEALPTANKTDVYGNETVTLTAQGCATGTVVWDIKNALIYQRVTTAIGGGTYKVGCYYNATTPIKWNTITIGFKTPETVTITSNKAQVAVGEVATLTGSGCSNGGVMWNINGQLDWSNTATINRPGEYQARCFYSDYHMGPWVSITINQSPANALQLIPDKNSAGTDEPVAISAIGCTQGTVLWVLPNLNLDGTKQTMSGSMVLSEGPGIYKAYCVRFGVSGPESSITITPKPSDAPRFYASKSTAVTNEYIELIAENCPGDHVQWGIPKKDAAGNTYYDYSYFFKSIYVRGPAVYKGRCTAGPYQSFQDVKVHQAPGDGLYVITNKSKAKADEAVTLFAYGCSNGTVRWKFGTDLNETGFVKTRVGPGTYFARCEGDNLTNKDWVRVIVRPNGNMSPVLATTTPTACPSQPVTVTASGCPAGWSTQVRWVLDGQQENFDNNRGMIENMGQNYFDVFGLIWGTTTTQAGPRKYWARCVKPDYTWYTDFNDAYLDIEHAIPDFKISSNTPIFEGNTLRLAATNIFGSGADYTTGVTYAWDKWNGTAWVVIAGQTQRTYNTPTASTANSGKYRCRVTVAGGCQASAEIEVVVNDCSVFNMKIVSLVPDNVYDHQMPVKLTIVDQANVQLQGWSYEWFDPNNNKVSELADAVITKNEGKYIAHITNINQPSSVCYVSGLVGNVSSHEELDHAMFYLDRDILSTKILIDRDGQWADLKNFGSPGRNKSNPEHFTEAYKELFNSNYNNDQWIQPEILTRIADQYKNENNVSPISVINMKFNYFDDAAVSDNLIEIRDGRLYDVPNRTRSPYLEKEVMVVSVLGERGYKKGINKFLFPKILYFGNTTRKVVNMSINFDNGSAPVLVTPDQEVTVNYTTLGKKTLTIVANFSDGTQKTTYDEIIPEDFYEPTFYANSVSQKFDQQIIADLSNFVPYNANGVDDINDRFPNVPGQGDLRVYFNKNLGAGTTIQNMPLAKPVIIIDGFDQGDKRKHDALYAKQFQYGTTSTLPSPTTNIVENLVNDGYQVFVLNFKDYEIGQDTVFSIKPFDGLPFQKIIDVKRDGGADYIERNARVLIKLIQDINTRLGLLNKTDKISIIGPSMGGLISRYALRYMELNNLNHNTKLWVSFDSPHHGANINIGDQVLFRQMTRFGFIVKDLKKGFNQLNSVAAKQLMIHHYSRLMYPKDEDDPTVIRGHEYHERFFADINAMGFPQNVCRVALINGKMDGTLQEGASTVECSGSYNLNFNAVGFFNSLLNTNINVKVSPGYSNQCEVYKSTRSGLLPLNSFKVKGNGIRSSIDKMAGGYYKVNNELIKNGDWEINMYPWLANQSLFTNQCFIPTASSIALNNKNVDWGQDFSNLTSPTTLQAATPFKDIYWAQTANEDHVFITEGAVNYIKSKLNATTCN